MPNIQNAFDAGEGILRLAPNWVSRSFCIPGRRIKLHPDDYYALGSARGGIDERWFASTTKAENGPLTTEHEGMSMVVAADGEFLLADAVHRRKRAHGLLEDDGQLFPAQCSKGFFVDR